MTIDRNEIAAQASKALLGTFGSLWIWLDDHYPEADATEIRGLLEIAPCQECSRWYEKFLLEDCDGEIELCADCRYLG